MVGVGPTPGGLTLGGGPVRCGVGSSADGTGGLDSIGGGGMLVRFDAVGSTGVALAVGRTGAGLKPAGGGFTACWIVDLAVGRKDGGSKPAGGGFGACWIATEASREATAVAPMPAPAIPMLVWEVGGSTRRASCKPCSAAPASREATAAAPVPAGTCRSEGAALG